MTGPRRRPGHGCGAGPGRRRWGSLAGAAALAALVAVIPALPAAAARADGNGQFGITPAPDSNGIAAPYFIMTVAPGRSAVGTAVISNLGTRTVTLKIGRSAGVTAGNGGSAFSPSFRGCSGPGCWVTGLPGTVTLPGGTSERRSFTVHVPARAAPGQYLAGITVESNARPRPVQIGSTATGAMARAIIIDQVTVGVAVTVGSLHRMTTRLRIPAVTGAVIGRLARVNILLRNTGQTFTGARGRASCTADGRRHAYTVVAGTILPHGQAAIPVNAPGLPKATAVPCTMVLGYGRGLTVRWAGTVTVPGAPSTRTYHTGLGAYTVVPSGSSVPPWAIALMIIGVLALVVMAVLLRRSRRRRGPETAGPEGRHRNSK
ncbi:MAG: hypothetical protein ABSB59_36485 [Streptosporangiaceae bacterium]